MQNDPSEIDFAAARADIAKENKDLPRRVDATGKVVVEKTANKPFFVHQDYKRKQAEAEAAKAERKRVRFEKIARGEQVGPDPDEPSRAAGNIFRFIVITLLMGLYAGYFITGDPLWGYENKWLTVRHWASLLPDTTQTAFSESQLAKFDGSDPEKPVYLAYDGIVYDVTEGRRIYGPGGGYHQFAGRDAARAFVTGCFKEHLTHDVRGFNEDEEKSFQKWKKFYAEHKKYRKVGTVYHAPIHPSTPIPPPCDNGAKQEEAKPTPVGPQLPPAATTYTKPVQPKKEL